MDTAQSSSGKGLARRLALPVFIVLFCLFAANVLLGKAAVSFGWDRGYLLSDLWEFILLLAAAVALVAAALAREHGRDTETRKTQSNEGEENDAWRTGAAPGEER